MKILPQHIFSEFKDRILEPSYHPEDLAETLKARLTAVWLLQHTDPCVVQNARVFIQKTSTFKEEDLARLQQLAASIKTWDELKICSVYTNITGSYLEYSFSYTTRDDHKQTLHFHARYEKKQNCCYFVSQTAPLIRVIGDPILQQPGILFPQEPTIDETRELAAQIEHAKSVLIQTGGAGIAANQCAAIKKPYRFTIVGVFYDTPEHVMGVEKRYPGTKFPPAMIMLNPVITTMSKETQSFNHACLSVPCGNRCAVMSPLEMGVRYQDPLDDMRIREVKLTGVDAVVLWHELTHVIHGKTYMDVTFESLPVEDLFQFRKMLHEEIQHRKTDVYAQVPELSVPPFYFSVKVGDTGVTRLDARELAEVLPKIAEQTVLGLLLQASEILKKKQNINDESPRAPTLSVFSVAQERRPEVMQHQFATSKL